MVGVDYDHNELTKIMEPNVFAPSETRFEPSLDRVGTYANQTLPLGPVTVTADLRYDDTSRTDPFWSPSLGATLRLGRDTVLRALAARGFSYPSLADLQLWPDLKPERVWSYQAGVETAALSWLWLKVTGFHHDLSHSIEWDADAGIYANSGESRRTGFEAEAEAARWAGLTPRGGFAYIHVDRPDDRRSQDIYQANAGLSYQGWLRAELLGHLVWWDMGAGYEEGKHTAFLWDLAASKTVWSRQESAVELFGTVRNLFDGERSDDYGTPGTDRGTQGRWVEAGARLRF